MTFRVASFALALALSGAPALAADETVTPDGVPMRLLAPADEYFGHARLSVLGIANTIRDAGSRLDEGAAPPAMIDGPLAFAEDAVRDWERQFPSDPWIARDLFALERSYLKARTPRGTVLARKTAAWLVADYPDSPLVSDARLALGDPVEGSRASVDPWSRFAALRAPLPTGP